MENFFLGDYSRRWPRYVGSNRITNRRKLRYFLQLFNKDHHYRVVSLLHSYFSQRLYLQRNTSFCQNTTSHEMYAIPKGGNQKRKCRGKFCILNFWKTQKNCKIKILFYFSFILTYNEKHYPFRLLVFTNLYPLMILNWYNFSLVGFWQPSYPPNQQILPNLDATM